MYTVKVAAEKLGISVSLLYALVESKQIRHERHGLGRGRILISTEALEEYRKGREVGVENTPTIPVPQRYHAQNF